MTGGLNEGLGRHRVPECAASAARMLGSIVIAAADPSSVHRCASASVTWQLLIELGANVGKSEGAKRRNNGAGNRMVLECGGWNRKREMWRGKAGGRWMCVVEGPDALKPHGGRRVCDEVDVEPEEPSR